LYFYSAKATIGAGPSSLALDEGNQSIQNLFV
jgi:hypothetical protein